MIRKPYQMTWKRCLMLPLLLGVLAGPVRADYDPHPDSDLEGWLWDRMNEGVTAGIKAGAEALAKEWLTVLAKAVVDYFSPAITELLFGSDDAMEEHTRRIIAEVRAIHEDLVDRNRELLDEIMDEYEADLEGTFNHAVRTLESWSDIGNPMIRIYDVEHSPLPDIIWDLGVVRDTIEAYLMRRAENPRIQHRRLQLLSMHMLATQLEMVTWQIYYNTRAIERGFSAAHPEYGEYGTWAQYLDWRDNVTDAELVSMQSEADASVPFCRDLAELTLGFYETLADFDDERAYVDDIFTPVVSHMEIFLGNPAMFDSADEMNNEGNWGTDHEQDCDAAGTICPAYVPLDGQRYYYYVKVPNADCLDGDVFDELVPSETSPWAEDLSDPSASACNRYWIVDRRWVSDAMPEYNSGRGSFENYDQWFQDSFQIWELHKELVHGDMLRATYGPVALFLDTIYEQYMGGSRPHNHWDDVLARYDELVGLLGAGRSYTEAVAMSARLAAECGATIESVGLTMWYEMLVEALNHPEEAIMCQDALEGNNSFADAAQIGQGYVRDLNLNTQSDVDIIAFPLLADNAVLVQLFRVDGLRPYPTVELYWQGTGDEEPVWVATASYDSEYGLSIRLPETEGRVWRHGEKTAYVVVSSEAGVRGTYDLAIETRGPDFPTDGGSSGEGGSGGGEKSAAPSSEPEAKTDASATKLVASSSVSTSLYFAPTTTLLLDAGFWSESLFPGGDIPWVPESSAPYRLTPVAETESSGPSLPARERSVTVNGVLHTGGTWITNHTVLGQTGGADIDSFVVAVPRGERLEVTATAMTDDIGHPYVEIDSPAEARTLTVKEPRYQTSFTFSPFTCRDTVDVGFSVKGLFSGMYRKDTGPYQLTARLLRTSDFVIEATGGLCGVKQDVAGILGKELHDPSDLAQLQKWEVAITILEAPTRPGDPYVLAAVNAATGQVLEKYKLVFEDKSADKLIKTFVADFNKAQMGTAAKVYLDTYNVQGKEPPK